tara:strand:- start:245 stop:403 length:159 start_codon:yes stop_codon:yes gene_type:complete
MPKMTKAQGRRLLMQAKAKFMKVYVSHGAGGVRTTDMEAIEKIVKRCSDRMK